MNSNSGSSTPVIGEITAATGTVIVIKPDGTQKILEKGSKVYLNDRVVTENGGSVVITTANNQVMELGGQQQLILTDSMLSTTDDDFDEDLSFEEVQAAIAEGADPAAVAQAAAAGDEPGSSDEGSSDVVTVQRKPPPDVPIIENEGNLQRELKPDDDPSEATAETEEAAALVTTSQTDDQLEEEAEKSDRVSYKPIAQTSEVVTTEDASVLKGQLYATDENPDEILTFALVSPPAAGSLKIAADGSFEFSPEDDFDYLAEGENQTVTFVFVVTDSQGNTSQASVDIKIEGINDTPEVEAPVFLDATQNDDSINLNLLQNASDRDITDELSVTSLRLVSGNEAGVSIGEDGSELVIDPAAYKYLAVGETETLTYEYRVTDSQGDYTTQTATITLTGSNDLPVIDNAVVLRADQNSALQDIDLLAGASDVDGTDTINVVNLQLTAGDPVGITVSDDGNSLSLEASAYDHLAAGESETLEYTYELDDGHGETVSQTASVTIEGRNDTPEDIQLNNTVVDENATGAVIGILSTTDIDVSDTHTYTVDDHRFEIVDNELRLKTDIFLDHETEETVTVNVTTTDSNGADFSESFTVNVNDINEAPETAASSQTILEDNLYRFKPADFPYSDTDDGDILESVFIDALPAKGVIELDGRAISAGDEISRADIETGKLTFLPDAHESATDYASFQFRVNDGELSSFPQLFTFSVTPVVDAAELSLNLPDALTPDYDYSISSFEDAPVSLELSQSLVDTDGSESISLKLSGLPADSVLTDGTNTATSDGSDLDISSWQLNQLQMTPPANSNEEFTLTFTSTTTETATGETASVVKSLHIDLIPVNDAPETVSAVATIDEDTPYIFSSSDFAFTDIDTGDAFEGIQIAKLPAAGKLLYNGSEATVGLDVSKLDLLSGRLKFEPALHESGANYASFEFKVSDGELLSETASFGVDVTPVNDAPDIPTASVSEIGFTFGGAYIDETSHAHTLPDDYEFGEHFWVLQFSSSYTKGVNVEINENDDGTLNVKALAAKYVTNSVWNSIAEDQQGSYFDTQGSNQHLAISSGAAGFGIQNVSINGGPVVNGYVDSTNGTDVVNNNLIIEENSANGSVVATITATDVEGDTLTYSLTNNADGRFTINSNSGEITVADGSRLNHEDSGSHSITVKISDGKGGVTTRNYTVNISDQSEAAIIDGEDTTSVTEDDGSILTTSGTLELTEQDEGEDSFVVETVTGSYGSLAIDASGNWIYSADNSQSVIQALGDDDSLTETITVQSVDGTTKDIVITINGINDLAVINGADTASISEDDAATLTTSGVLSVTDTDTDEALFTAVTVSGTYGSLTIDANGHWNYSADNSQVAIQALGNGDSLTETITVQSVDGTAKEIVITINGTNDVAVIGGVDTATVTEDDAATLTASGALTVSDTDTGEASFTVETVTGTYGSLTIDASGNWNYSADNTQAVIQALGDSDSLTETITVKSFDNTTHDIVITINGTNDAAVIGGVDTATVAEDDAATLTASGALTVTDTDTGEASFTAETVTGSYGSLTIDANGNWIYSADNTQAAIQALGDGDSLTETITIKSVDNSTHDIVITINGTNDAAIIGGVDTASLKEDVAATLTASGALTVSDVDTGESSFTAETVTGTYGSLTIDASGNWSYSADNSQAVIQALGDGDSLTETITVKSVDNTLHDIVITINGTNDAAVIGGVDTATVKEDDTATLTASGALTVSDVDTGESSFTAETVTGTYGSLTIDASGNWSYSADNSQAVIQALGDGDSLIETITVKSFDNTTHDIVITINGTNDAAVIGGADTASVTEDDTATLNASGALTVTDADTGEASFTAETVTGSYGSLTIDANGNWSYSADNTQAVIQALGDGDSLTETITVKSFDSSTHDIVITINGTNDAAVIGGVDTASVTEDDATTLTASGALTISDVDTGESSFTAETVTGTYGSLTIDASGNWNYSADNSQAVIQALDDGDSLTETIMVKSTDNTIHNVVITINGTNDAPVATDVDLSSVNEDTSMTITEAQLLANASDVDGDTLNVSSLSLDNVAHGSVTDNGDGTWTFNPAANFNGSDVDFTLTISDGTTTTSTKASVEILAVNDAPEAQDLSLTTSEESASQDIQFAATDIEGDSHGFNILSQPSEGQVVSSNAVGLYSLTTGSSDLSKQGLDGSSNNGVSFVQDPERGPVADFDNNGIITLAAGNNASDGLPTEALTVGGWVKVDSADTWGGFMGLFQDNGSFEKGWVLGSQDDQFSFALKSSDRSSMTYLSGSGTSFNTGEWYHVAATYDGSTMKLFVNGDLKASSSAQSGDIDYPPSGVYQIGAYKDDDEFYGHDGQLSEFRVYDKALSESQIQQVMAGGDAGDFHFEPGNDFQDLAEGESRDVSFTYEAVDSHGLASDPKVVTVTVTGTNDAAVISGADTATFTEDDAATLTASGKLDVTDIDTGEASFSAETVAGSYGSFTIDENGNWSYSADNSQAAIQALGDGDSLAETITVKSVDNTTHDIVITINGTNDAAVIGGADTASVTEDDTATLTTSGALTVSDADTGEASFTVETVTGSYGSLTIDASGNWSYSADNSQAVIQALGDGDSLIETITVKSVDGTNHDVTITINGTNDAAVIGGVDTASIMEDDTATLTTSGALTVTDTDIGEASFTAETVTGSYGSLTIDASGNWSYSADNTQAVIQALGDSDSLIETITVKSVDNTTHDIVITINGTNDAAVIGGADTASVTEDDTATLNASGALTASDVDTGESSFTAETVTGSYGSLTIDASGNWSYSADNSQAVIQALGAGDSLIETITVKSFDNTTHDIVITINGTNDAAVIGGVDTASVTEDDAATLTASGALTVSDVDTGESSFTAETITGSYGSLTIDASGNWSYSADNSQAAIQALGDGDSLTETITVKSFDNTTHDIVITINGTNDAAIIGGVDTASLKEDVAATLTASGALTVSDADTGEASFTAETVTGTYGSLTIDANGNWSYSANNTQAAIQALGDGDSLTETITVKSLDNTLHDIVITINGTNDAAVINGVDTATVKEDDTATLTTSGALTVTDTDIGEASFTAETVTGSYGSLTIDANGNWSYSADNTQAAIQALGDGDSLTETITVKSFDSSTHDIVITINGTNDAAVIGGVDTASVTEDDAATLTASGALTVSDVDTGESSFTAETVTGTYGSLTIDASGNWSYSADNSQAVIQALGDGDSLIETITVKSVDNTTHDIVITINGTNDAAVIGGADTASVTEDDTATLNASGALTVTDADTGEASFTAETVTGSYGSLTIDANGNWSYSADNTQAAIQALGDGDSLTETITVKSFDSSTHDIVITINGTNDAAVIGGVDTASVTEDDAATLTASGALTISDVDTGESSFTAETVTGTYGSLTIDASGNWSYSADNSQAVIQALGDGDSLIETITVKSVDNTTHDIVITINGTNDAAVIGGADTASVTEDDTATLTTSGALTVTDTDIGEASFTAETVTGSYGSLTIGANGNWSYSADNTQAAIQALGDGDSLTETITVKSFDSSTHDIVITINGTNDAAVIGGVDTASVTEDDAATLTASGALTISDVDTGESSFTAETVTGTYGSLTIDASGNWNYSADNSQAVIQALGDGDSLTETITIKSVDNTLHDIAITINGTNDAAVIGGVDTASVTEDDAATLTASGALTISDVDTGESSFTAETVTGTYGSLTIDASGNWSYSADNSQAVIQALGDGDSLTETITIKSVDNTLHDIAITINGTNDAAVIGGVDTASVTEDDAATLTASGALTISDVDTGESSFTAETVTGTYGSLTIDASGNWSYSADNSQAVIQALGDGDSLTETITIKSVDNTLHDIAITINGTNDAAVIGGVDTASVTEDDAATLTASGALTISDVDTGESSFTAETVTGSYGSLTIDASGNWSYSADNSQAVIQALGVGDSLIETITVKSFDNTTHDIVITINGTNDAAVIGGVDTATVAEDDAVTLTASGALTVTDTDTGEASFTVETVTGSYGSLTIDANGNWSYSADNTQAAIQALGDGDSLTETITVKSFDSSTHDIVITINGTNDAAVIGGVDTASVTEDDAATLTASGALTISDVDTGESSFTAETITGSYGSLTIDASGNWSYSADNSQAVIQALGDGDSLIETITVKSVDNTTHDIVITINGTNDAAVIGGVDTATVAEDDAATLTASGALTVTDTDTGEASFTAETVTGSYGSLTIDANGNWIYSADNTQAAIQALGDGDSLTETITIKSVDNSTHDIVITINGTNDAAIIGGVDTASLKEDVAATLTASGALTVSDVDTGESSFTAETVTGTYGSLTIDASGNWSYSADNTQAAIQALGDGDSLTETITVKSFDSSTHDIVITINGTNDAAVIGGVDTASVTEDDAATLTASGALTISDVDTGESSFTAETVTGSYGSLTIDASGNWSYSADNSQAVIQALGDGDSLIETITVKSVDNTTHDIVITINGTNDAAVIGGADTASVTEDDTATLNASGALTVTDADTGEASFTAETVTGSYGSLTIDANGNWSYSADNTQAAIQALGDGDSLTETITVKSFDSSTHDIVITINGTNDAAVIGGVDTASVTEDDATTLTASGALTISDVDTGESSFTAETVTGTYGSLTIDASGNWNYSADNSQAVIQALGDGDSLTETITIKSVDNTLHDIAITINGTNDAAVISGVDTVSITEDDAATLIASGALTVSDTDTGEASFTAETVTGTYGSLTIDASGNWSYSADNSQAVIQALGDGDSLTETITVKSFDNTTHDIVITINGTNDAAVIGGADTASVTEDDTATLNASGALTVTDADTGEASFTAETVTGSYGSLTIDANGNWSYSADNTQAAIQALGDGDSLTETITVKSFDSSTHDIVITINGTNDAAVIGGVDTASVTEDDAATLTASGALTISDVDTGESSFTAETVTGTYGSLTIDASGNWNYSADNSQAVIQALGDGDSLTETITIKSVDNTLHDIAITINGTNDAAVISGVDTVSITEDDAATLIASGALTVSDTDTGESSFTAETVTGSYGSLTIDASGNWSYSADNSQAVIQALGNGDSLTETITVKSVDGTTHDVTITINGTNDAAVIGGVDTASVTEDDAAILTTSGALTVTDADTGEASFTVETVTGSYGSLTIDANGNWSYSADNTQAAIQALGDGDSLTETITVKSFDSSTHDIVITINGTNDAAVIGGVDTASVTEDDAATLTASGALTISDVDTGESSFTAETVTGTYGSLTIDASGNWSYSADNSQAAIQALGDGDSLIETITVKSVDNTTHDIVITINGTNDAAVIGGADTASVTEDDTATLTTSGALTVTDTDIGEASFTAETVTGSYGSLTIDANGNWSYSADNTQAAIQALGDGDSLTETITIKSVDNTTHDIVITINGTNDAAIIGGVDTASVTEDDAATLTTSGALTVSDADTGEASFTVETVTGSYGSLTIDASGNWSYSADNSQAVIQALGDSDSLIETITVKSVDGTTHDVTITINGTNDAAVIGGVDTASIMEDDTATLTTSGALTVTDTDIGEASFTAETVTGSYGSLTIDANGNWSYSADNTQAAIQALGDGDSLTETITVKSFDSSTHDIVITINGTNDAAVIGGVDTASVTEDDAATLTASGALTISDVDTGESSFTAETVTGTYGSLTIDASGNWNYSADNSQAVIQALGDGDSLTETITIKSVDNTLHDIAITINGTNDAAVISGVDTVSITEDDAATLIASGALTVSDTDTGEASFTAETVTGTYGSLTIDASGNWSYSADNSQAVIQALGDGDSLTETITVKSFDNTTHDIVITINGTNDAAVIGGVDTATVKEDDTATLTTSGALTVSDADTGEASFTVETVTGSYGSLTIDASGNWSYSADNSQAVIQALGAGDSLIETITVKSFDNTTHDIVITINGTNDAAVIGGVDTASVTEDDAATLTASGALTISDVDTGESSFTAETVTGSYGSLTIDASGNWSYSADNSQAVIQALGDGDSLTETITIKSVDNTTHDIVITINGTNDAAVIGGVDTASVTEDDTATLTTSGALTVSDADTGEASFTVETVTGSYGSLTIDASGNWSYSADNTQSAIQALGDGDSLTETITIKSVDNTLHDIAITINGTNDAAVISGVDTVSITEDDAATLIASGALTVSDTDTGEASFTAETVTGTYGSLTIDASGNWSYSADNQPGSHSGAGRR